MGVGGAHNKPVEGDAGVKPEVDEPSPDTEENKTTNKDKAPKPSDEFEVPLDKASQRLLDDMSADTPEQPTEPPAMTIADYAAAASEPFVLDPESTTAGPFTAREFLDAAPFDPNNVDEVWLMLVIERAESFDTKEDALEYVRNIDDDPVMQDPTKSFRASVARNKDGQRASQLFDAIAEDMYAKAREEEEEDPVKAALLAKGVESDLWRIYFNSRDVELSELLPILEKEASR